MIADDADAVAALFLSAHADGGAGGWKTRDITRVLDEGGAGVIAFAPGVTGPAGAVLAMRAGADMDIVNIAVGECIPPTQPWSAFVENCSPPKPRAAATSAFCSRSQTTTPLQKLFMKRWLSPQLGRALPTIRETAIAWMPKSWREHLTIYFRPFL